MIGSSGLGESILAISGLGIGGSNGGSSTNLTGNAKTVVKLKKPVV